ncbi:MAG: CRISPR-associated helicase Cas3' [Pirellula sp.]
MSNTNSKFIDFFSRATRIDKQVNGYQPRGWQSRLAVDDVCRSRLIHIPTGEGKTLGALSSWIFHRIELANTNWPRRLVWCLPMRTLVEQTINEAQELLKRLDLTEGVSVYPLMGGSDERRWYDDPVKPAILVGTQDMLLSRALNRGYAMGRAAWPRAYGLLNTDTLWVMDEIQLMGIGLTTSCQIQSFFQTERNSATLNKPRATWWMSATLQPDWLKTPETEFALIELKEKMLVVEPDEQTGEQWKAKKPVKRIESDGSDWAEIVADQHYATIPNSETGKQTLVVVNTVKAAVDLYAKVTKRFTKVDDKPEIRLIHSRFRPAEREGWLSEILSRSSLLPQTNRILISTQVVEAGVDISATCLITELAPWPSLVQRFGRAARYGGTANIFVLDSQHTDAKKAAPYHVAELDTSRAALDRLSSVAIGDLQSFEQQLSDEELKQLYPFDPVHVLMRTDFEELFDTSPDLSGADVDVARFIREGDDRNVMVFWREWDNKKPSADISPQRRELCPVPIGDAKTWLSKVEFKRKWAWDYLDGEWIDPDARSLRPGQVILVHPEVCGYDELIGFTGAPASKKNSVTPVNDRVNLITEGDFAESNDDLSETLVWKTICTHCREAGELAATKCVELQVPESLTKIVVLALRLHDWGKSHPAFASGTYNVEPLRADLAKAPHDAWRAPMLLYKTTTHGPRRGFRHELASGLAVLELLRHTAPGHDAVLGTYRKMLVACGMLNEHLESPDHSLHDHPLAIEIQKLSVLEFNLLLYLIVSHHGKVRCSLQSSPIDQDFPLHVQKFVGVGMPIRGVREHDQLPATKLPSEDGSALELPAIELSLDIAAMGLSPRYGACWIERVQMLIEHYGPFTLAWLEALVRAIDGWSSNDQGPPGSLLDPLIGSMILSIPKADAGNSPSGEIDATEGETEETQSSEEIEEETHA